MKPIFIIVLLCITSFCYAQLITKKESSAITAITRETAETHKPRNYVFRNANLITMTDSILVNDQDVLVVNGLIKTIGSNLKDIGDAIEIDATDRYLMPGLAEMHAHVPPQRNQRPLDDLPPVPSASLPRPVSRASCRSRCWSMVRR